MAEKNFSGAAQPSGSLDKIVTRCHTGRSTPVGIDYRQVEEWSNTEPSTLRFHVTAARFRTDVQSVTQYIGPRAFFRGRRDDGSIESWRDMGPPPKNVVQEGRYAAPGIDVLYLCDSSRGVQMELNDSVDSKLFIQELLADSVRLADFTDECLNEFVKAVFDISEKHGRGKRPLCFDIGSLCAHEHRGQSFHRIALRARSRQPLGKSIANRTDSSNRATSGWNGLGKISDFSAQRARLKVFLQKRTGHFDSQRNLAKDISGLLAWDFDLKHRQDICMWSNQACFE